MNDPLMPATQVLSDGLNISYRRCGKGSRKILLFHGFPGSSAQIAPFEKLAAPYDLDVICADRPGYNFTSPRIKGAGKLTQREKVNRSTLALVGSLGWDKFEVFSVSGGTPFLLAFLAENPKRVLRTTIVCGLGPLGHADFQGVMSLKARLGLAMIQGVPSSWFNKALPRPGASDNQAKFKFLRFFLPVSTVDQRVVEDSWTSSVLVQSLREAFAQGGIGPKQDAHAYLSPDTFDHSRLKAPIDIWHGAEDYIIPVEMAKRLSLAIPEARLHIEPDEGHYSLAFNRVADFLTTDGK